MEKHEAALVFATQAVMTSVISELIVLLPKDQRAVLRERLKEHHQDIGGVPNLEPDYSDLMRHQYQLWDDLLAGKKP